MLESLAPWQQLSLLRQRSQLPRFGWFDQSGSTFSELVALV